MKATNITPVKTSLDKALFMQVSARGQITRIMSRIYPHGDIPLAKWKRLRDMLEAMGITPEDISRPPDCSTSLTCGYECYGNDSESFL